MRVDVRTLGPLLAVLVFLVAGLLRCQRAPEIYAPTALQLAAVLSDTDRVRAAPVVFGGDEQRSGTAGEASGSWDVVSSYVVTAPDGTTGHLSVASTTLRSHAESVVFFEHFADWLTPPTVAPHPHLRRTWLTPRGIGRDLEPEQSRDFHQVSPDGQGRFVHRSSRLMRDRLVVVLVSGLGVASAERGGPSEYDMLAFEPLAAWVKGRLVG